jgi:hypothetical protein
MKMKCLSGLEISNNEVSAFFSDAFGLLRNNIQGYGIPFVPAERNDNKRAIHAHLMISAT